jgi:hypothetical protein
MLNGRPRDEAKTGWREFTLARADGFQSLQSSLEGGRWHSIRFPQFARLQTFYCLDVLAGKIHRRLGHTAAARKIRHETSHFGHVMPVPPAATIVDTGCPRAREGPGSHLFAAVFEPSAGAVIARVALEKHPFQETPLQPGGGQERTGCGLTCGYGMAGCILHGLFWVDL